MKYDHSGKVTTAKPYVFGPFGVCIYCGSTKRKDLSREHVMPFGLGGGFILLKASCEKCREITSAFEQTNLRTNFGRFRSINGLPTRRPRERPTHHPLIAKPLTLKQRLEVSLQDSPNVLVIPKFVHPPGMMSGQPAGRCEVRLLNFTQEGERLKTAFALSGGDFGLVFEFDNDAFVRLLAKVAHGFMYASYDMAGMKPLLLDIILNGSVAVASRFMGNAEDSDDHPEKNMATSLMGCSIWPTSDGHHAIVVKLQLFPFAGAPAYQIIVGYSETQPRFLEERMTKAVAKNSIG